MNSIQMPATRTAPATVHPAFEWVRSEPIVALGAVVEEYRHRVTGAQHFHIATDNPENVFLVALRTVPEDSTGVAHILEHTALCGSEKYPVRDPFFMMTRRSLNTFMNAFTSSDWTAYPFASQNRKDFFNLLDVYLDAVFFARLDPLRLRAGRPPPGVRHARGPGDAAAVQGRGLQRDEGRDELDLQHAVADADAGTCSRTPPTTTTRAATPSTSRTSRTRGCASSTARHYHPSNAVFMSYGDIAVPELHERFEIARAGTLRGAGGAHRGARREALRRAGARSRNTTPGKRKAIPRRRATSCSAGCSASRPASRTC